MEKVVSHFTAIRLLQVFSSIYLSIYILYLKDLIKCHNCIGFAGPTGEIVAAANDKDEDVLVADFNLDKIKSQRHGWGVFRDRRPELYKSLLSLDGSCKW